MNYDDILDGFRLVLKERYPGGFNYIQQLADILGMSTQNINRRLRGISHFTIEEMAKICFELDISMDRFMNFRNKKNVHPMKLYVHNFKDLKTEGYKLFQLIIDSFEFATESGKSNFAVSSNNVPGVILCGNEYLTRYMYLRWLYFNPYTENRCGLKSIDFDSKTRDYHIQYNRSVREFSASSFIVTKDMIRNFIQDIIFFYEINILEKDDLKILYEVTSNNLDKMEALCENGRWIETGNEVTIYLSDMLLDNDICIIDSDNIKFAILYAFTINPIVSENLDTFETLKSWIISLTKVSNVISISSEKLRREFFSLQRKNLAQINL